MPPDPPTPTPQQIVAENVRVHAAESLIYDRVHGEIFNAYEQGLLERDLDRVCADGPGEALDLGAGTGNISLKLARRGLRVTALDLSPRMLEVLAASADAAGLAMETVCEEADAYLARRRVLPPVVTMSSFLHHVPHPWRTLRAIADRVPPGGRLYVTHEPTGRRRRLPLRLLDLADRALWNLRHPVLTRRARRIDYTVSDHHAREGLDPDRMAAVLAEAGLVVEHRRLYTSARSRLLSRVASRLGGQDQVTLIAVRPAA